VFLDTSRYAAVAQDTVQTGAGRTGDAIRLRALPPTAGDPYTVLERDRLDLLAQPRYTDDTKFWHVADANTALDARELTAQSGAVIAVPRT
jgi:hypothetical protein